MGMVHVSLVFLGWEYGPNLADIVSSEATDEVFGNEICGYELTLTDANSWCGWGDTEIAFGLSSEEASDASKFENLAKDADVVAQLKAAHEKFLGFAPKSEPEMFLFSAMW